MLSSFSVFLLKSKRKERKQAKKLKQSKKTRDEQS